MRSAVAIITDGTLVVLVKRKTRQGDPWSGDIAFPGGHVKDNETPSEGVIREISEEVNLYFSTKDIVIEMEPTFSMKMPEMPVYPFVIGTRDFIGLQPGPEIQDARVFPIDSGTYTKNPDNGMPALKYGSWIVWGLTYRILSSYLILRKNSGSHSGPGSGRVE